MRNGKIVIGIVFSLLCLNCGSLPKGRVIETESGTLEAIGLAKNEPDARIAAVDQAASYCSKNKQKPIFRDDQLQSELHKKRFDLDLKNIPMIGKVLKSEDKSQVVLAFRCNPRLT